MKNTTLLLKLTRRIPDPVNYFAGLKPSALVVPSNILLFKRQLLSLSGRSHHYRFVLILNLQTSGDVILDDVFFRLNPGHALLVFPYQFHGYHLEQSEAAITWLFVTFETDHGEELSALRNHTIRLSQAAVNHAVRLAELYLSRRSVDYVSSGVSLFSGLLLNELLATARKTPVVTLSLGNGSRYQLLTQVARIVEARLHEGIGVKEVARAVGISPSNLRMQFRKQMGMSLGRYVREKRILRAANLLTSSNMRLAAIAQRCGLGTQYSLSRAFKRDTGKTPRAYRAKI